MPRILLSLINQYETANLVLPTHFSVPFPSGLAPSGTAFTLVEKFSRQAETGIIAQFDIASSYRDNSIRFLHVFASVKWVDNIRPRYELVWNDPHISGVPSSPLTLNTLSSGFYINTGVTGFLIPSRYPGLLTPIISSGEGPTIFCSGAKYTAAWAGDAVTTIVQSGAAQITLRMENPILSTGTPASGYLPFAKYITYITAYANSYLVNFNHAVVFTSGLRYRAISSIGLGFPSFSGQILTKYLDGKIPMTVLDSGGARTFFSWPPNLEDTNTSEDYSRSNIHKLGWLCKGPLLNNTMPTGYRERLTVFGLADQNPPELTITTCDHADMAGVSMHSEFCVNLGPSGTGLSAVYENKPIGYVTPINATSTNVFGPMAGFGRGYEAWDEVVLNSIKSRYGARERYNNIGWHIFGAIHEDEVITEHSGRPHLHRLWSNNHYWQVESLWNIFFQSANTGMLRLARIATDLYTSVTQVKHNFPSGVFRNRGAFYHCKSWLPWGFRTDTSDGEGDTAYASHWVNPTALMKAYFIDADFWAREGYIDWASGILAPTGSIFPKNHDGNNWLSTGGYLVDTTPHGAREVTNTLVQCVNAYDYMNETGMLYGIRVMISGQKVTVPSITGYTAGTSFWQPEWMSRYYETFPSDTGFIAYLRFNASGMDLVKGTNGCWTLALGSTMYDITKDPTWITRYSGVLDRIPRKLYINPTGTLNDAYRYFGNEPGQSAQNDGMFGLQWGRYKHALQLRNYNNRVENRFPLKAELGAYPTTSCNVSTSPYAEVSGRGTQIVILNTGLFPTGIVLEVFSKEGTTSAIRNSTTAIFTKISGGAITPITLSMPCSASVPSGQAGGGSSVENISRSSSWYAIREIYDSCIPTGLSKLLMASPGGCNLFRPVSKCPEALLLIKHPHSQLGNVIYNMKVGSGVIYPFVPSGIAMTINLVDSEGTNNYPMFIRVGNVTGWLRAGQIRQYSPTTGIFEFQVFGDGYSYVNVTMSGYGTTAQRIGLYGSMSDIETLLPYSGVFLTI